jgi:acetyl-CoA acetyltransferase
MSEEMARSTGMKIYGYLDGVEYAAVPPGDGLLMAPALALPKLLKRHGLQVGAIDLFEIHEAFAAQVLCNLAAWERGWERYPTVEAIGAIPRDRINVYGGSIALGHPFAATGGRLLMNLCQAMERKGLKRGVISVCAAGGGAAAALVSRE